MEDYLFKNSMIVQNTDYGTFAVRTSEITGFHSHYKNKDNQADAESHIKVFTKTGESVLYSTHDEDIKDMEELLLKILNKDISTWEELKEETWGKRANG
jgi:uncharacterized protein YxeA